MAVLSGRLAAPADPSGPWSYAYEMRVLERCPFIVPSCIAPWREPAVGSTNAATGSTVTGTNLAGVEGLTNLLSSSGRGLHGANPEAVWVDDSLPPGADLGLSAEDAEAVDLAEGLSAGTAALGMEIWRWTNAWPCSGGSVRPLSGTLMHVSPAQRPGLHQHYFVSPGSGLLVNPGDLLLCYVNIDSNTAPSEIMLQWHAADTNGAVSWEHRAYWGADDIAPPDYSATNRFYAGPVPPPGEWLRLAVPAEAVDLAGRVVQGIAFTLTTARRPGTAPAP